MSTSRQIEDMCLANPPRAISQKIVIAPQKTAVPPQPSASATAQSLKKIRKPLKTRNPLLNYEDLPEVALKKEKVEIRAIDPIDEAVEEHELGVRTEDQASEGNHQWTCPNCTFLNNSLLGQCEMCDTTRCDKLQEHLVQPSNFAGDIDVSRSFVSHDWPSLEAATDNWLVCDASSIASSWLEVPYQDESDEDLEGVIVLPSSTPLKIDGEEKGASWSARVASIASIGDAPKIPAAGALMPPLFQKRVVRKRPKSDDITEELDLDLESLELRRLRHQKPNGNTHHHRLRKR
jgi:hypothetical protein